MIQVCHTLSACTASTEYAVIVVNLLSEDEIISWCVCTGMWSCDPVGPLGGGENEGGVGGVAYQSSAP